MQKAYKHNSVGYKADQYMEMATTVYKPVHVITKNSKIYDKVTATVRGLYLLHADEHTHK